MRIKQIEFNNFRIYKGFNQLRLDLSKKENITVVSGENGFGKTTLLMGLVWCLYGKQMERVDAIYKKEIYDKGGYSKYIGGSLNKLAEQEGIREFQVAITFAEVNVPEVTCQEVTVKRSYNTIGSGQDKIEILIDGMRNELIEDLSQDNQRGEEIFIRDYILPLEIAKFFFFDAEKIVALADGNSVEDRRDLSLAYSEVLGIKKYEDLRQSLEGKRDDYRKISATVEERNELIQLEAENQKRDTEIKAIDREREELEEEKTRTLHDSNEIQTKLIRLGNRLTEEELTKLRNEEKEYVKEGSQIGERLRDTIDLLPFALAGGLLLEVFEQVTHEEDFRNAKHRKEEVDLKINVFLTELERIKAQKQIFTDFTTTEFYTQTIQELMRRVVFSETTNLPAGFNSIHELTDSEKRSLAELISTLRLKMRATFEELTHQNNRIKNQIDQIRRKIRDAEKEAEDEYTRELRLTKDGLDRKITTIQTRMDQLLIEIGEKQAEIKANRQRHTALSERISVSNEVEAKDRLVAALINELLEFSKRFKEEKKRSLEDKIKKSLNALMHKKDFVGRVAVDINVSGEDVDINLYDAKNKLIDRASLSMGERQLFASSLLMALVDESDIEFPVFIDSPMQKFDQKHAENIIKYFYPNVSKQVVILPLLHKELTRKEYDVLKPGISMSYLIRHHSNLHSYFEEVKAENLIDHYDSIYNAN
jgi:DNA sulfur modification protein DndD